MDRVDTTGKKKTTTGLAHWMWAVLAERVRVLTDPTPDAVHDLRVALRRCRSLAEGFADLDPAKDWPRMRKAGKAVFRSLGDLRDTHVLVEWIEALSEEGDPVRAALTPLLEAREAEQSAAALEALEAFDVKAWEAWARRLPERASQVPLDSPAFAHLALRRWQEAVALHRAAVAQPAGEPLHRLRIGVKRFRYTVENFLPGRHARWGKTLKKFQDLLGEVHDLDVLETTLPLAGDALDVEAQARWQARIEQERRRRVSEYLRRSTGDRGAWQVWREGLPARQALAQAALDKLAVWGAFHDPDPGRSRAMADRAEALYRALRGQGLAPEYPQAEARRVLRAAALMRFAGDGHGGKAAHKRIAALEPPLGWTSDALAMTALVVRYFHEAPRPEHKAFRALAASRREAVVFLAGLLRAAEAVPTAETAEPDPPAGT